MKFIVFSHPRSGTSYFCGGVLSRHKQIHCYDEILNNTPNTIKWLNAIGMKPFVADSTIIKGLKFLARQYKNEYESYDFFSMNWKKKHKSIKSVIKLDFLFAKQVPDDVMFKFLDEWKIIFLKRDSIELAALSY